MRGSLSLTTLVVENYDAAIAFFTGKLGFELRQDRNEALLPSLYAGLRSPGPPHDLVGADTVAGEQHDLGAARLLLRRIAVLDDPIEPISVGRGKAYRDTAAHPA